MAGGDHHHGTTGAREEEGRRGGGWRDRHTTQNHCIATATISFKVAGRQGHIRLTEGQNESPKQGALRGEATQLVQAIYCTGSRFSQPNFPPVPAMLRIRPPICLPNSKQDPPKNVHKKPHTYINGCSAAWHGVFRNRPRRKTTTKGPLPRTSAATASLRWQNVNVAAEGCVQRNITQEHFRLSARAT